MKRLKNKKGLIKPYNYNQILTERIFHTKNNIRKKYLTTINYNLTIPSSYLGTMLNISIDAQYNKSFL